MKSFDITYLFFPIVFTIYAAITIFIRRKYLNKAKGILYYYKDYEYEETSVEIDYSVIRFQITNSYPPVANGSGTLRLYENFIYIDLNGLQLFGNRESYIFPMILCGNNYALMENFPNHRIAKMSETHLTPWNSVKINAQLIGYSANDIELNILFLKDKDKNAFKLKKAIEEMMKAE